MVIRKTALFVAFLCFGTLETFALGQMPSSSVQRDAFLYDGWAYFMLPPEPISPGGVTSMAVSPSGSSAVMMRTPKMNDRRFFEALVSGDKTALQDRQVTELLAYSQATKSTKKIWSGYGSSPRYFWLGNTDSVLLQITQADLSTNPPNIVERLAIVNAALGTMKWIESPKVGENEFLQILMISSPTKPEVFCLAVVSKFRQETKPDGKQGTVVDRAVSFNAIGPNGWMDTWTPFKQDFVPHQLALDHSGTAVAIGGMGKTGRFEWFQQAINLSSWNWQPYKADDYAPLTPKREPMANLAPLSVPFIKQKVETSTAVIVIPKDNNPQNFDARLIAFDCDQAPTLSDKMTSVFYLSRGVAYIREFAKVSKEIYQSALEAVERTRLLSQVKQVGTGFLIYASDYDDTLPSANGFDINKLDPYLKNQSLLNGFVYTFGGGNIADIKDPANTLLGYAEGAGGRAEVYADGHAVWKSNSKASP